MKSPASAADLDAVPRRIAVVGLGLLGGSVAMSLKRYSSKIQIVGCGRNETTRKTALHRNIADEVTDDPIQAAGRADLCVIATPVDHIADLVVRIAAAHPGVTITDVGSTKASIVRAVSGSPAAMQFVAAHPIAGGEKSGLDHARADLFDKRTIVVTPSGKETPSHLAAAEAVWRATGGEILRLSPEDHDAHLAVTSHLPHLLAALAAKVVPKDCLPLVGKGWRDTTRIAAGDPDLWTAIVSENQEPILAAITSAQADLESLRRSIAVGDRESIRAWLSLAQTVRNQVH